jgi:hypothetical protein
MNKYSEFILERQIQKILESQLVYSKSFLSVLNSINSPIANKLKHLNSKDLEIQQNFIDTTDKNDQVTFVTDKKAQQILGQKEILFKVQTSGRNLTNGSANQSIYDDLKFERPEDSSDVYRPSQGAVGRILGESIRPSGKIYCLFECTKYPEHEIGKKTILNKEALEEHDENDRRVWTQSRTPISVGRLVRSILKSSGENFSDSELEKFVNDYKSTIDIINDAFSKFDILSGHDISRIYNQDNYESDDGTLGQSCMSEMPEETFQIYTNNPDVCRLVVLYSNDGSIVDGKFKSKKICGRAILWTTRSEDIFMDRIYTNRDSDVELFKKFAAKNGWWCKKSQNSSSRFSVELGNQSKNVEYIVDLKSWKGDYPYLDSLCYLNSDTGELSNSKWLISADYLLNDTSGGYESFDDDDDDDD